MYSFKLTILSQELRSIVTSKPLIIINVKEPLQLLSEIILIENINIKTTKLLIFYFKLLLALMG